MKMVPETWHVSHFPCWDEIDLLAIRFGGYSKGFLLLLTAIFGKMRLILQKGNVRFLKSATRGRDLGNRSAVDVDER